MRVALFKLDANAKVVRVAEFGIRGGEIVVLVEMRRGIGEWYLNEPVYPRDKDNKRTKLTRKDGVKFLKGISQFYNGSYFWATITKQ